MYWITFAQVWLVPAFVGILRLDESAKVKKSFYGIVTALQTIKRTRVMYVDIYGPRYDEKNVMMNVYCCPSSQSASA